MTNWSINGIAEIWLHNGGARGALVDAVSVAMAESGGNDHAISPAWDYGLFQINVTNWQSQGLNGDNWKDPNVNTQVAIRMSGNGTNWAPWCTAWTDPGPNCGHGLLPHVEAGSPAGAWTATVSHQLAQPYGVNAPPPTKAGQDSITDAWRHYQTFLGPYARLRYGGLVQAQKRIKGAG